MLPELSQITQKNILKIQRELSEQGGAIFIAKQGCRSWRDNIYDANFYYFAHPHILEPNGNPDMPDSYGLVTCRDIDDLSNNREYSLIRREKSGDPAFDLCLGLFEKKKIGSYEFRIEPSGLTYRRPFIPEIGMALHIPDEKLVEPAFRQGITTMVNLIDQSTSKHKRVPTGIGREEIESLVEYMVYDLKTKEIFEKNLKAGQTADNIYFGTSQFST